MALTGSRLEHVEAFMNRMAYPRAGEALILDDYRNIARNIMQMEPESATQHYREAAQAWFSGSARYVVIDWCDRNGVVVRAKREGAAALLLEDWENIAVTAYAQWLEVAQKPIAWRG